MAGITAEMIENRTLTRSQLWWEGFAALQEVTIVRPGAYYCCQKGAAVRVYSAPGWD